MDGEDDPRGRLSGLVAAVNWLIRSQNLAPSVNLTILTSACVGAAMLNTEGATAGVLLAGCHETQFNCKALRTKDGKLDPWMSAIASTIDYQVRAGRILSAFPSHKSA